MSKDKGQNKEELTATYTKLYKEPVSADKVCDYQEKLGKFFELLIQMDRKQKKGNENIRDTDNSN